MDQADSEPKNEESSFHTDEDNYGIVEYGEGEGENEEEEYIRQEQYGYSSYGHSELNDNTTQNQEVNYQEGATIRGNMIDQNNEAYMGVTLFQCDNGNLPIH